jgi:hypothetical protein
VAVKKLPGIVECTGAVVQASENSSPEALLTLRLKTGSGTKSCCRSQNVPPDSFKGSLLSSTGPAISSSSRRGPPRRRHFSRGAATFAEECPFKVVRTNGSDEVLARAANLLIGRLLRLWILQGRQLARV